MFYILGFVIGVLLQLLSGDIMLAVSEYTRQKLLEYASELLPPQLVERLAREIKVLYAPFDHNYFAERSPAQDLDFKRKYRLPEGKIISYFGRLFPEKGVEDLLRAFPSVKAAHPDVVLVIGGQGVLSDTLKLQAQQEGITDVIFTGGLSNSEKRSLMQLSYIAVIPTKPVLNFVETLCISALEFLASRTPLVTTRVGGVPEAAGPDSVYVEHSSPGALAVAINGLLDNDALRQQAITSGLAHVKRFDYSLLTQQFLQYVERCRA